jgi:hypothetical protein
MNNKKDWQRVLDEGWDRIPVKPGRKVHRILTFSRSTWTLKKRWPKEPLMPLKEMKTLRLFVLVASIFLHTPNDIIQQVTFQRYHLISVYSTIQSCPRLNAPDQKLPLTGGNDSWYA